MNREKFFSHEFPSESLIPYRSMVVGRHREQDPNEIGIQRDFIPYDEIIVYLRKLRRAYPDRMHVQIIGKSKEGKNIYMVSVVKNLPYQTLSTVVEAGSHGKEWYSVTSALYLIDYLVKTPNSILVMDYYIIPCLNPDAYDYYLSRKKKRKKPKAFRIDLNAAFPKVSNFQAPYVFNKKYDPEIKALYRVLNKYKQCVRMFISLKEKGRSILYPWAHSSFTTTDYFTLQRVALSGQKAMSHDVCIGTIAGRGYRTHGAVVDYVKFYHPSVKFTYLLNLSYRDKKSKQEIVNKAQEVCDGVRAMARAVYKHFAKQGSELVDVNVKIPNFTERWNWIT